MMHQLLLLLLQLALQCVTVTQAYEVFVYVNSTEDLSIASACCSSSSSYSLYDYSFSSSSSSSSSCYCSLRAAWSLCASPSNSNSSGCHIHLPAAETLHHNMSAGPLVLTEGNNFTIHGHGATVQGEFAPTNDFSIVFDDVYYDYSPTNTTMFNETGVLSFIFHNSTSSYVSIGLNNLTIQSFGISDNIINGGSAISVTSEEADVFFEQVQFVNNQGFNGGAVAISAKRLIISSCSFANNTASHNGGTLYLIHIASARVSNTSIVNSTADLLGGGMFVRHAANMTIINSYFSKCAANLSGGGLSIAHSSDISISTTLISHCESLGGAFGGGGLLLKDNLRIYIFNLTISNSFAKQFGGGLTGHHNSILIFSKLIVSNCFSSREGGGITLTSNALVSCEMCYISHCSAKNGVGGGISLLSNTNYAFKNSLVSSCSATGSGGGIYMSSNSNGSLEHISISGCNSDTHGGGISLEDRNAYVRFVHVAVTNNVASISGGGVFIGSSNKHIYWLTSASFESSKKISFSSQQLSFYHLEYDNLHVGIDITTQQSNPTGVALTIPYNESVSDIVSGVAVFEYENQFVDITYKYDATSYQQVWIDIYATPLYPQDTNLVNVIKNNQAGDGGGIFVDKYNKNIFIANMLLESNEACGDDITTSGNGGALYVGTNNDYFQVINMIMKNNKAIGNGGGMYADIFNRYVQLNQSVITENIALEGGGLYLSTANSVTISNSNVSHNTAGDNGSGMYFFSLNNVEVLNTTVYNNWANYSGGGVYMLISNEVIFNESNLLGNNVAQGKGGGVFCFRSNTLTLGSTMMEFNEALDGGGIFLEFANELFIENSQLFNNSATGNGGCINIDGRSKFSVWNTTIDHCIAHGKGGYLYAHSSEISMYGFGSISNSYASNGGAFFLENTKMAWNDVKLLVSDSVSSAGGGGLFVSSSIECNGCFVTFESNSAKQGSALYLYSTWLSINGFLDYDFTFVNNQAVQGATLYVILNESVGDPRVTSWNNSEFTWQNNTETYGNHISSQPTQIVAPYHLNVSANSEVFSPFEAYLYDYFNNFVTNSINGKLVVGRSACKQNWLPYLAGEGVTSGSIEFINGVARVDRLQGSCFPEGSISASFISSNDDDYMPASLSTQVTFYFQKCNDGEVVKQSFCRPCPLGSFSLQWNSSSECESCTSQIGIKECERNQILLHKGYWRRHYTNTKALFCPYGKLSCLGNNATGDSSCALGYKGPLCAVCWDNYYLSNGMCNPCQKSLELSSEIVLVCLLALAIGIGVGGILWCRQEQDKYEYDLERTPWTIEIILQRLKLMFNEIIVKLKIVVSTYQVVICSADVFHVAMPNVFQRFLHSFSFMNFNYMSILQLDCWRRLNFFQILLWSTISPFILIGGLIAAGALEHFILVRDIKTDLEKVKTLKNTIISRYLNYIFYVTYLVLPSVTTTIFQVYVCTNVDPASEDDDKYDKYLRADMSIACGTPEHENYKIYGYFMIILYPVGIPLFYYICLYWFVDEIVKRHKAGEPNDSQSVPQPSVPGRGIMRANSTIVLEKKMSRIVMSMSFLWQAYKPQFWYWELIETARRILLTAVLSICSPGSSEQNVLGLLMAFFFTKVYGHFQPYSEESDFKLSELGQSQIFITFFGTLVVSQSLLRIEWESFVGGLLVTVNLMVIIAGFYYETLSYLEENEEVSIKLLNWRDKLYEKLRYQKVNDVDQNAEPFRSGKMVKREFVYSLGYSHLKCPD